jgi:predicted Zn finger-like uncharacterized protein
MIQTNCPHCRHEYRLPDTQLGKRVRCKNCSAIFPVEPPAPVLEEASPTDLRAVRKPAPVAEELPILEEYAESPRSRPSTPPPRRRDEDDRFRDEDRDRRSRRDDWEEDQLEEEEDRRGGGSGTGVLVLCALVCLFLLLVGGGGLAWYFASSSPKQPAQANNSTDGSGEVKPGDGAGEQPAGNAGEGPAGGAPRPAEEIADPKDLASALTLLKDARAEAKKTGLRYLRRVPKSDQALNRGAVGAAVRPLVDDPELGKDALQVLVFWGSKEAIPKLTEQLTDAFQWQEAARSLAEIPDDEAAELLAKQLAVRGRAFWLTAPLSRQGKRAEKYVVKYLHHPDFGVRNTVSQLLQEYGTSEDLILEQTTADLTSTEKETSRSALKSLQRVKVSKKYQEQVARGLEVFLSDNDLFLRRDAVKVLSQWATTDNLTALHASLQSDLDAQVRETILDTLARLKSEESITPVALRLGGTAKEQFKSAQILLGFGSKAEKAVQLQLTNGNANTRRAACELLAEIGTKDSVTILQKFGKADRLNVDIAAAAIKKIRAREKEKEKDLSKGLPDPGK